MSKKKYTYEYGKEVGCNAIRGWLLSAEEIAAIKHYLFLAGLQFQWNAKINLKDGMPKPLTMHEWRKYREVIALCSALDNLHPHAYVRA